MQPDAQPEPQRDNSLGMVALILGVLSLLLVFCFLYLGLPVGIVAAVVGAIALRRDRTGRANRSPAMVGLVLGAIGAALSIVFIALPD